MRVNAILLKPLDGFAVGAARSFDKGEFETLRGMGAVREASDGDAVPDEDDEQAVLLEKLRHPVDGPKMLDELKARFERMTREHETLTTGMVGVTQRLADAETARDAVAKERDEARDALAAALTERDDLTSRLAAHEAKGAGEKPAGKPANKAS